MHANGNEQRCGSKRAATEKYRHSATGTLVSTGFGAHPPRGCRGIRVSLENRKFRFRPDIIRLTVYCYGYCRIPVNTAAAALGNISGLTSAAAASGVPSHLLGKPFQYSQFQLNDIVHKGN